MKKPVCHYCGAEVEPGTLVTHVAAHHPKVAERPGRGKGYVCRAAKCVEVYGPRGHVPGLEGPHAY